MLTYFDTPKDYRRNYLIEAATLFGRFAFTVAAVAIMMWMMVVLSK